MSSHIIVYLDQNYLSNMAKARVGLIKDKDLAKFWHSLFNELKKAVLADKIACPESEFHRAETSYTRRLEELIRKVIDELSRRLKFHPATSVLESQIEDAAKNFLGKQLEERESWTIAFKSNPHAPVESRMTDIWGIKGQINVHLSFSDEIVEHDRQLKNRYVEEEDKYRKLDDTLRKTYDIDVVLYEKMSFIDSFFLGRGQVLSSILQQWYSGSIIDKTIAAGRHAHYVSLWERLAEIGMKSSDTSMAADFLQSSELLNIPYIDIFCSINAAIIKYFPDRKCKGSDLDDVATLATVLPYCDVITTDSFMKEILVNRLLFDDKYKAMIFSATKTDRLAFQEFIRGL